MATPVATTADRTLADTLRAALKFEAGEGRQLFWAAAYFFCLLSAYYLIRPLRDAMGITAGPDRLQWVFTATFIVMLLAVPVYGWLTTRYGRARLVPLVYGFFILNLVGFFAWFSVTGGAIAATAFFVWTSVFNLFVVSVFWSLMADFHSSAQARRLFGLIAIGGSLGALCGPLVTALAVPVTGELALLPASALLLGLALVCFFRLQAAASHAQNTAPAEPLGGSVWAGLAALPQSKYLLGVVGFILLLTTLATFVYFMQAQVVADAFESRAERTQVFAWVDFAVNATTLTLQAFFTARIIARIGVAGALALLPGLVAIGFLALAAAPLLPVLLVFQVLRRAGNYGITRPAREILFTVVSREQKYKAKSVIDTLIYRGGDALSGWLYAGLKSAGLGLGGIAALAVPLALLWLALGLWLGREQNRRQQEEAEP